MLAPGSVARLVRAPGVAAIIAGMRLPPTLCGFILAAMTLLNLPATAAGVATSEPEGETLRLWPGGVPGAEHVTAHEVFTERAPDGPLKDRVVEHVDAARDRAVSDARAPANGVTLLIVPGGGYARVVLDKEGFESAQWFAARGFECAVLRYRLPADGWAAGADAPVLDGLRALRLLRNRQATAPGTAPSRLGVMGFSAGGHLVARLITNRR